MILNKFFNFIEFCVVFLNIKYIYKNSIFELLFLDLKK